MVELVLTYCLLADPAACIERRPVLQDLLTPLSCMMLAQQVGARYAAEHPAHRLIGWRCEVGKPRQRAI